MQELASKAIDVVSLTKILVNKASVTPEDAGCQDVMVEILEPLGFRCEFLESAGVRNLWARLGEASPVFAFAGHTDVVPTGPEMDWQTPPFECTEKAGVLYGRGCADMKGSLAAMLSAVSRFCQSGSTHKGSIAFLITSDEEGPATDGTVKLMHMLDQRGERIDWCLVGEPSSKNQLGDCVRVGRRGSLGFRLCVKGVQGHVAYPEKIDNPIHKVGAFIEQMQQKQWDTGNEFFPATSFQFSNIHAGTGATNVVPGHVDILGNFRFSTESSEEQLRHETESILKRLNLDYAIDWTLSGQPFLTRNGFLIEASVSAIKSVCGIEPELSTAGGTSDGRFIAPYNVEVIELGPENETIHKVDEAVSVESLNKLEACYYQILCHLLASAK